MPLESFRLTDERLRHQEILAQGRKTVITVSLNACDSVIVIFLSLQTGKRRGFQIFQYLPKFTQCEHLGSQPRP